MSNFLRSPFFYFFTVDGGYTSWSDWSECPASCGGGTQIRGRTCTNPTPQHGGFDCKHLGVEKEGQPCNRYPCPSKSFLVSERGIEQARAIMYLSILSIFISLFCFFN